MERHPGDKLTSVLREICRTLMIERGLNPKVCGHCGLPQYRQCDIHHTRYEGVTIDDLVFVCRRCNLRPAASTDAREEGR